MRPLGIRAKVLLLALLPAAVSALLLGGYQLLTATQALQQALDERGQAITVHRLQAGDLATRLEVRSTGELGNLETGVNAMAAALQASHRDLEQRIALATQELRAALAERASRNRELEEAHRQAEQAACV